MPYASIWLSNDEVLARGAQHHAFYGLRPAGHMLSYVTYAVAHSGGERILMKQKNGCDLKCLLWPQPRKMQNGTFAVVCPPRRKGMADMLPAATKFTVTVKSIMAMFMKSRSLSAKATGKSRTP